jgi:tripartite-type tricarboxylate transporter receptor subunit TctC
MISRRVPLRLGLAGLGALCLSPLRAPAQVVPGTARILVGFPAGGGADAVARGIAEKLRGSFASSVIVENLAGAGGRLAVSALKSAAPDGRTMLLTPASAMVIYPHIYKALGYSPVQDFLPVASVASVKLGLIVGPGVPARSLAEYVRWVKERPIHAVYASPGAGTMPHFLGSVFARAAGIDPQHVPYKGAAHARQDLLGGQVPAYMGIVGNDAIQDHRAQRVRILAIADPSRAEILPDVPTFVEQGFKGVIAQEWLGMFVPARTPPAIASALSEDVRAALKEEVVARLLSTYAMTPAGEDGASFTRRINAELQQWGSVIRATGFTPQD